MLGTRAGRGLLLVIFLLLLLVTTAAHAQVTEPPVRSEEARTTFEQGLTAFDEGDYGM
ncbi:MAG: hypothetical protein GVY18_07290, partial [Bacteroidetes bacterium]|nr:hypothetical protein [Bacteroidota bacterium]